MVVGAAYERDQDSHAVRAGKEDPSPRFRRIHWVAISVRTVSASVVNSLILKGFKDSARRSPEGGRGDGDLRSPGLPRTRARGRPEQGQNRPQAQVG